MQAGLWFMDGYDLWTTFSVIIEEGSADFLRYPAKKESTTHDWLDDDGIDVDLSRIFLKEKKGVLQCAILAPDEATFFQRHQDFLTMLIQPGLRRLEFTSHNNRSYYVFYQENPAYKQVTRVKGTTAAGLIAHRFSISLVEPQPQRDPSNVYIITEDGKFLIC